MCIRVRWRRAVCALAGTCLALGLLGLAGRAASGVLNAAPWWFEDDYTSLAYVDEAVTTAVVDTSGTGTVRLPTVPAGLAFDPASSVGLIATRSGVQGWAFDGSAMVRAQPYDVPGTGYVGVAWIGSAGNWIAVATPSQVSLYAWSGSAWTAVGDLAVAGVNSVAAGAPVSGAAASLLVGTPTGFEVVDYRDGSLVADAGAGVAGMQASGGIASSPGGSLVAVWCGPRLSVYGWDGSAYRQTPTWEIPSGSQAILAVAWFRDGNGYWVLTADGSLTAYGFNGSFVVRLADLSTTVTLPVLALATGWRQGDVATLVGTGWDYEDGTPIAADAARSVGGLTLPLYRPAAQLQSTVLAASHDVTQLQIDAAVPSLPPGTAVAYQVSTDGGSTWNDLPPCIDPPDPQADCAADNEAVPGGNQVVYRLELTTADPAATPVVDTTDLYEIATRTQTLANGMARLIR